MIHPEGTIQHNNGQFAYNYHLADYAGNVRQVAAADNASSCLVVQQEMNYYPFGLAHNYNNLHRNRYLFTGKELQDQTIGNSGFLGLYDFGARYYNPMLGRWFNTDPALQTTNPYLFCGNAPTVYTDPDGSINYRDLAFENYATLKGTYIKESYHAQGIRSGKGWAQLPKEYQGLGIGSYLEEINGYNYAYKNQGLFRGHNLPLQGVEMYTQTLKLFDIPYKSYPKHLKWVYKIPRKW